MTRITKIEPERGLNLSLWAVAAAILLQASVWVVATVALAVAILGALLDAHS
tara:strand:- start:1 stop:156 length:156 start_codon:yes stop_codon:yes gene_type:complete